MEGSWGSGQNLDNVEPLNKLERQLLDAVIAELEAEFEVPESPSNAVNPSARTPAAESLARIRATARQEERIALLLLEILKDRWIGADLLRSHRPRAAFEQFAISSIGEHLFSSADPLGRDEIIISKLINALYTAAFPLNRGFLLQYLAKHLAGYPLLNKAIDGKLRKSKSHFVHRHGREITENLRRHR